GRNARAKCATASPAGQSIFRTTQKRPGRRCCVPTTSYLGERELMTITITPEKTTNWLGVAEELSKHFAMRAAQHDADDSFGAENYAALRKAKLFSAPVPAELGGGGASYAD